MGDRAPHPLVAIALVALVAAPALGIAIATALPSETQGAIAPSAPASYAGPTDGAGVVAACPGAVHAELSCYTTVLEKLLAAKGSEAAFDALDTMTKQSKEIDAASHPIAHELGMYAFVVHGTINETLRTCSFKVFAGCFHGALQAYFFTLPKIEETTVARVCPMEDAFRAYTCLHGLGHGLMLATGYDLHQSLAFCDAVDGRYGQGSCYGGVFMENFAGWSESQDKSATAVHEHLGGHAAAERYWLDPSDPSFPCDAVGAKYQWDCWYFHTSVVLYFNRGNFSDVIRRCAELGSDVANACYRSLGRDVSSYSGREPAQAALVCGSAPPAGQGPCARGFVADSIVFFATPDAGLPICRALPETLKADCYHELAVQGHAIAASRMGDVCDRAEPAFVDECRRTAGVA